jgi:hypothetical protein
VLFALKAAPIAALTSVPSDCTYPCTVGLHFHAIGGNPSISVAVGTRNETDPTVVVIRVMEYDNRWNFIIQEEDAWFHNHCSRGDIEAGQCIVMSYMYDVDSYSSAAVEITCSSSLAPSVTPTPSITPSNTPSTSPTGSISPTSTITPTPSTTW